jgi:hypothetical protein
MKAQNEEAVCLGRSLPNSGRRKTEDGVSL